MKSGRFSEFEKPSIRSGITNEDSIKTMYPAYDSQNQGVTVVQNLPVKDFMRQKDEVKRFSELRTPVRRTPIETHRPPRTSGSVASTGSRDKKKEGKGREGREQLAKTVDRLKFEKLQLERKVSDLMQAIHLAEVLNRRALLRGNEKDQVIMNLRKQSVLANDIKLDEINRRCRLEAELEAIRIYVQYSQQKKAEKTRNKAVQTETSIPANLNFDSIKPANPFKKIASTTNSSTVNLSKSYSSYKALESSTSLWKTKLAEQEFQKQTKVMKHRFMTAVTKSTESEKSSKHDEPLKISSAVQHRRYSYPAEQLIPPGVKFADQRNKNLSHSHHSNFNGKFVPSPPTSPFKPV